MERNEKIDALLKRWYAGETSDAEDAALRERFAGENRATQGLPPAKDDREIEAMLFAGFQELSAEQSPYRASAPAERIPATRPLHSNRRPALRIVWKSAAIAAVIVLGIMLGLQLRTPYCYIDGVAIYDKETALAATDCLKGLSDLELPERMLEKLLEN